MSEFETIFTDQAWPALRDEFGESATYYTPAGAGPTAVTVVVTLEKAGAPGSMTPDRIDAKLACAVADLTPVLTGRFVVGSVSWLVISEPVSDNGIWQMMIARAVRTDT